MTTPAASVLGKVRAVVEGARNAERTLVKACRCTEPVCTCGLCLSGAALNTDLAALPVATDEGAVEQLAQWLYEAGATRGALPWGTAVGTTDHYCRLARAVLAELLAGGGGGG